MLSVKLSFEAEKKDKADGELRKYEIIIRRKKEVKFAVPDKLN